MAKIPRITQQVFASTAGFEQVAEFGSLAAATPVFTLDVATIQSLGAWTAGWFNAVIGGNSPAIEDMNGAFLVMTQQLAYGLQQGIPEWDAGTTYYFGSVVSQPVIVFTVTSANATLGATYTNNSITFTVQATISAGTILICTASGLPTASGTLTKASGTGDSTITFSANTPGAQLYTSITNANLNQAVTSTSQWYKISPEPGIANSVLVTNSSANGTAYSLLTNANISSSAAIAYSKLNLTGDVVNTDISSTAAIAYSKLNLTGDVVNSDISSTAAIAYSKLNLTGDVVNADISSTAAIVGSKLQAASASNTGTVSNESIGTFTASWTQNSVAHSTQTITYRRIGRTVTLHFPQDVAASQGAFIMIALSAAPSNLFPIGNVFFPVTVTSTGVTQLTIGLLQIDTGGNLFLFVNTQQAAFAATSTCGLAYNIDVTYAV